MLRRVRSLWRRARGSRLLRPVLVSLDRVWWARTIRRADIVDVEYVVAQGGPRSPRRAVRAYVRDGFRSGMGLNPLFMERLVSSQLSDAGRVPALYAYLVNDPRKIEVSAGWDAPAHAERHPDALAAPGGPLGHAWREARDSGVILLGTGQAPRRRVSWSAVHQRAVAAVRAERIPPPATAPPSDADVIFVCRLAGDEGIPARPLREAAEVASTPGVHLILAIEGTSVEAWTAATLLESGLSSAQVVADRTSLPDTLRAAGPSDATLLVRGPHAEISSSDLRRLADLGSAHPTAPLWLGWDGAVAAAGVIEHAGQAHHLLSGHPAEDARALGRFVPSAVPAGATFALRLGAEPTEGARTATELTVRAPDAPPPVSTPGGHDTDLEALLAPLGLLVREWTPEGPKLLRPPRTLRLPDGTEVASLRWAIKIAAPPGRPGEAWGDTHFARGVADALRRLGQDVVIDAYAARARPSAYLDDVVLALRGPEPIQPQPGAASLLWIISHPDEITAGDLEGFDRVFAASEAWAAAAQERFARTIDPLLQCTDTRRFHPAGLSRDSRLVFVGTARGIARPSIVEPIRAGVSVSVYGPDWRGYIPASAIVAEGIANHELPGLYESAGAVLNDHWPAMQREGFISNRLFDVVAAGGRAISDQVAGIQEIFSGAVATYETIPDLLKMVEGDLDSAFPGDDELAAIAERVRADHSFDSRARTLLAAALLSSNP